MTRFLLINAGPTPWDEEDRIVGNHSLPLTDEARAAMAEKVDRLFEVTAVYRCKTNEACEETARLIADKYNLRPGHNEGLDEINLGLWQGLRREELKFRFPKVVELWQRQPLAVEPPEGESVPVAAERLTDATRAILKRNRGGTIALPLRPIALKIIAGFLRRQPLAQTVLTFQGCTTMETIDLSDEDVRLILD